MHYSLVAPTVGQAGIFKHLGPKYILNYKKCGTISCVCVCVCFKEK